ncbi:isocitrate lyase-like [Pocillopora verrucosa]|uniref:isocitrate lyase-like n=1 Tax=Pocillopora verrucosa TaxID=203993 RepID=UPI002797488C|nr:isocitrate lyase-like [Pocillopora verrucosa]
MALSKGLKMNTLLKICTRKYGFTAIRRDYGPEAVEKLRGSLKIEYTLATRGAQRLWKLINRGENSYVNALGAMTGGQAVQMAKAGLHSIYLSGWQVAADSNMASQTYPDQSLYPANSAAKLVERINNAFIRADQIAHMEGNDQHIDFFLPIVADCEAGFGGPLNAFEITKSMILAGAAGVHFEDQLASEKKCGHMGGKVLLPTQQFIKVLNAARLATDVMGVPTVIIGRTDAESAALVTSDIDPRDQPFLTGERTAEGFYRSTAGLQQAIARGLSYAPYCDIIWCETGKPNLDEAHMFADGIHSMFPGKPLAYNCSPSFNWRANLSDKEIAEFQKELGKMGYRYQFITLAGFHSLNHAMFKLARDYKDHGMSAYTKIQEDEFAQAQFGFTAHKHQREVGTGYFDQVSMAVSGGTSSTTALEGSTETEQFCSHDMDSQRISAN